MPVPTLVEVGLLAVFIETIALLAGLVASLHVSKEILFPLLFDPGACGSPLENALILLGIDVERLIFCGSRVVLHELCGSWFDINGIVIVERDAKAKVGGAGVYSRRGMVCKIF